MSKKDNLRTIKLFCPSVSKLVEFVAWEEERLDIGSIARSFGLDPSTVKLNGHFVSRGVDFVSCSVTWRSLLSFFSSKGYSSGESDGNAVVVDGKLFRIGSKRTHDTQDAVSGMHTESSAKEDGITRRNLNSLKNKRLKVISSEFDERGEPMSKCNGLGPKRSLLLEDGRLLKKLKINERSPGATDFPERRNNNSGTSLSTSLTCGLWNDNMKRTRDEELAAANCKRIKRGAPYYLMMWWGTHLIISRGHGLLLNSLARYGLLATLIGELTQERKFSIAALDYM